MNLFLMCCLFLFSGMPECESPQQLAAANAMDRRILMAVEQCLDAEGSLQEILEQTRAVLQDRLTRLDPAWVQRHPDCRAEDLDDLWTEVQRLEGMQTLHQRGRQACTDTLERISRRQEKMDALHLADAPVYAADPVPEAMIRGTAGLPTAAGGAAEEGSWDAWLSVVCPAFDVSGLRAADAFVHPIPGACVSAGTWSYPGGGLHLGLDLAAPLYTDVHAPADGVVLYQSAGQPADSGYPGNQSGYPGGAGNSILLLCPVQDRLYSVALYHLSNIHHVRPGQSVRQGDVIALSGNAGNSTGPHTHIELCELTMSLEEAVSYFLDTADFSFGTGWDTPGACSQMACRMRPEQLLPAS